MRNYLATLAALDGRYRALRSRCGPAPSSPVDGGPVRSGFTVVRAATAARTKVMVYGYIGDSWWDDGVTAADFVRQLDAIGPDGIDLHVNSGGGSVFDAIAMHAALLNHPSDVHARIDGVAASAASFLVMAGDKITIEKPAKMMIHNAAGIAFGNKAVLRELADVLDELDATMAQMYADRSGRPAKVFADAMDAETWYSSAQAVDAGLADEVANDRTQQPEDRRTQLLRARARVTLGGVTK